MQPSDPIQSANALIAANNRLNSEHELVETEISKLKLQVDLFNYEKGGKVFWCKSERGRAVAEGKHVTFTAAGSESKDVVSQRLPSHQKAILKSLCLCLSIE